MLAKDAAAEILTNVNEDTSVEAVFNFPFESDWYQFRVHEFHGQFIIAQFDLNTKLATHAHFADRETCAMAMYDIAPDGWGVITCSDYGESEPTF